jgi:hypothetical protein
LLRFVSLALRDSDFLPPVNRLPKTALSPTHHPLVLGSKAKPRIPVLQLVFACMWRLVRCFPLPRYRAKLLPRANR